MNLITYKRDSMGYPYLDKNDEQLLSNVGFPALKGANLLTPEIVGFVVLPDGYVEISKARYIPNPLVNYGVTVVKDGHIVGGLSNCFRDWPDVVDHVDRLTEESL